MAIAVVGVSLLVLFMLGWRESVVVAVAIPSTLSLMLLVFHLLGYTLNRVTLFALIFSIGILVDDAIVVVENIVRHRDLEESKAPLAPGDRRAGGRRGREPDRAGDPDGDRRDRSRWPSSAV